MTADHLRPARELQDQLVAWRRDIHRHPELGFQERRTSALVADTLRGLGIATETGVGKTGVVGRLGSGHPAIGLRADMDALAIEEANDVPYASQTSGLMHACGHDAHTAMLLGAATILTQLQHRPAGEIRLLFQPSEEGWDDEGKGGASRMIEDGALEGLDAVLALHVDSTLPCGAVAIRSGYVMAGVNPYDATILGTGSHSAAPHHGVNPIVLLARVVETIQSIPSLHTDPLQPAIISCEAVHGGSSSGVIPDQASLHGNIRYYDPETKITLREGLAQALSVARALGGDYRLTIQDTYPPTRNDTDLTAMVWACATELVGEDHVLHLQRSLAGEDFGYMSALVPGCYFKLGVQLEGEERPYHNPRFDIDEAALPVGTAVMVASALRFLEIHGE